MPYPKWYHIPDWILQYFARSAAYRGPSQGLGRSLSTRNRLERIQCICSSWRTRYARTWVCGEGSGPVRAARLAEVVRFPLDVADREGVPEAAGCPAWVSTGLIAERDRRVRCDVPVARFSRGDLPTELGSCRKSRARLAGNARLILSSSSFPLQLQQEGEEDPRQGRSPLLQECWSGLPHPQGGYRG